VIGRRSLPEPPTVWVAVDDIADAAVTELEWDSADRVLHRNGIVARAEDMGIEVGEDFAGRPRVAEADAVALWSAMAGEAEAARVREFWEREQERLVARDRGAGRVELNARELMQVPGMAQYLAQNPGLAPRCWSDDDPENPLNQEATERARVISMRTFGPGDTP